MTILVAEDETMMLKTIEFRLKKDGHIVIATKDGKEALEKLNELSPDLVITDIMMPFSSGLEIINSVRRKTGKKIPIIVLSAMGQENMVMEAFKLGVDDYIKKPFSPNELSVRVSNLLQKIES